MRRNHGGTDGKRRLKRHARGADRPSHPTHELGRRCLLGGNDPRRGNRPRRRPQHRRRRGLTRRGARSLHQLLQLTSHATQRRKLSRQPGLGQVEHPHGLPSAARPRSSDHRNRGHRLTRTRSSRTRCTGPQRRSPRHRAPGAVQPRLIRRRAPLEAISRPRLLDRLFGRPVAVGVPAVAGEPARRFRVLAALQRRSDAPDQPSIARLKPCDVVSAGADHDQGCRHGDVALLVVADGRSPNILGPTPCRRSVLRPSPSPPLNYSSACCLVNVNLKSAERQALSSNILRKGSYSRAVREAMSSVGRRSLAGRTLSGIGPRAGGKLASDGRRRRRVLPGR